MGLAIPQVVTTDRASGAQVIDGSLKFDGTSNYLTRSFSTGNRRKWTWAAWVKRYKFGASTYGLFSYYPGSGNGGFLRFSDDDGGDTFRFYDTTNSLSIVSKEKFRDTGWYHIVIAVDTTQGTDTDRVKRYVNGVQQTINASNTWPGLNDDLDINNTGNHYIGRVQASAYGPVAMSNVYFIDNQALGPENFGFTDPLTNTWRPKKYTGTFITTLPGKSESDTYADSGRFTSYATFGTVTENDTGYTLPSGSWSHYGGKVKELDTGGFQIVTVNSATTDFFMGCWVKFESYVTGKQIGINLSGTYVYWETRASGAVGIRQDGISRADSSATSLNDGNWHHIALSRTGGTLYGFVDGTAAVSASVSSLGNSVGSNSQFWFFGGSGTSYNIDGQIIDPVVYIGEGKTSYTTPSSPLIDSSGNVNELFGINNSSYLYYASPGIDLGLSGGTAPNSFYLPFDGNSPIGKDQSGNGNDWTPVNFGGSVELDKATGARPILNTTQGGTQAGIGVFGSKANKTYTVTYADDGGGNKYYIDGVKQATLTGLIRGATYTFNTVSLGSTHPFRLSATSAHGTEYTNGVVAVTGAATTITIPYNAPNALYYYCTAHSGMGSSITGITTNEKLADQYASNCVLGLPLVGGDNDVSASIACTSTTKTITVTNAAASIDSSNFYAGSFEFDGSGDYLVVTNTSDLVFEEDTFTIECWMYAQTFNSITYPTVISKYDNGDASWILRLKSDGDIVWYAGQVGGGTNNESTTQPINLNKWHHLAVVREGTGSNQTKVYVDGILQLICNDSSDYDDTNNIYIGRQDSSNANEFDGYIQDVRIYNGITKYTASTVGDQAFVVASTSPDILPDTPSGVSGSSKLAKITDGTVSFDGTGFLTVADGSNDFSFGTGAYTVEGYLYPTTLTGNGDANPRFFCCGTPSASSNKNQLQIVITATGQIRLDTNSANYTSTAGDVVANKWQHIAVARDGSGNLKAFVDGRQVITQTSVNNNITNNDGISLGIEAGASSRFTGFMSNVRILKGTALYTSNFTPLTRELTNVTNTKLLCCQSNSEGPQKTAVIPSVTGTATAMWPLNSDINDDSGNSNTLTENGGSTSFTSAASNSFGITNAANFAKDAKYLSYAVTPASAWTIDGYVRLETTTTSAPYILGWNGTNGSDTCFGFPSDGSRKFSIFGSSNLISDVVAEIGRWYHIRMTTNSTSDLALYVDGVLAARSTSSDGSPASPITIGDIQSGRFSGQIAGVRYTPTDLGAPPLGGENTSSGVTSNSPSVGVGLGDEVLATNFNPFNTDIHAVRGQETGYATLNPLYQNPNGNTTSDGNLTQTTTAGNGHYRANFNIGASSGKFYFEYTPTAGAVSGMVGLCEENHGQASNLNGTTAYSYYGVTGNKQGGPSAVDTAYGTGYTFGDVIGVAFDSDNNTLEYFKNGVSEGVAFTSFPNYPYYPAFSAGSSTNIVTYNVNFGQKPFKFPPPDGFQPLNAANVRPETVIPRPDQYVGIVTYTGDNSASKKIDDLLFSPDLVWVKDRNLNFTHFLNDTVRGAGKILQSNASTAETNNSDTIAAFPSFDLNGFTVGTNSNWQMNGNNEPYVGWCWKAGGSKGTFNIDDVSYASAAAAGLDGGLTVTGASVGTKQGFSIIKATGSNSQNSFKHGLGKVPKFVIAKDTDNTRAWYIYHGSLGANYRASFDTTEFTSDSGYFGSGMTDTLVTLKSGGSGGNNYNGADMIYYVWADVPGLQKFGQFIANASGNGPFVELGFRPSILWVKASSSAGDMTYASWLIVDGERSPTNVVNKALWANKSATEGKRGNGSDSYTDVWLDILSNGFKIRYNGTEVNGTASQTYIYCAWAEAPSVDLYGGGANAR